MKKVLLYFLTAIIVICLAGCGDNSNGSTAQSTGAGHKEDQTTSSTPSITDSNTSSSTSSDQTTSQSASSQPSSSQSKTTDTLVKPDIDISAMGTNVIYSKATEIMGNYTTYLGKTIRIKGNFKAEKAPTRSYYYCLVNDPTACCNAGFEFVLKDKNAQYPASYPSDNAEFIVQGKLHSYKEGDKTYLELIDATIVA